MNQDKKAKSTATYQIPSMEAEQVLIIPGRLAGRNEAERAARSGWVMGNLLKREQTLGVESEIMIQRIQPVLYGKAKITLTFYEPNARRDADNVIAGSKYILDALKEMYIIVDDSQKYVELFTEPVKVDKLKPRIEVRIFGLIEDREAQKTNRKLIKPVGKL